MPMPRRFSLVAFAVATPLALLAPPVWAQGGSVQPVRSQRADAPVAVPSGIVRGEVLDAATAQPLSGATVVITPASPTAALPSRGRSPFVSAARSTKTDADGRYRFTDIVPGQYRLHVQRLGYQAASLELALEGAPESRVSVGLEVAPVRLAAMRVESPAADPATLDLHTARFTDTDSARLAAARARQEAYLSADVREITPGEVRDAATLGEADLLRALDRLPGIRGTAVLNVRGARWDLSPVYFDGVPLFAPFHSNGLVTGVPADAIALATVLPGVRPASYGEGAAGIIDLRSRSGTGTGRLNTRAELSLLTSSLAFDQRTRDGGAAWYLGARASTPTPFTLGRESAWVYPASGRMTLDHYFADVSTRADLRLGARTRLEVSGLLTRDRADDEGLRRFRSTEGVARTSLLATLGQMTLRQTLAHTRSSHRQLLELGWPDTLFAPLAFASHVGRTLLTGELIQKRSPTSRSAWRGGYELTRTSTWSDGSSFLVGYGDAAHLPDSARASHWLASGWGERRWMASDRLELSLGLRLETGSPVADAARARFTPRVEGRFRMDSLTTVSAGLGRHWQYAQMHSRSDVPNGASDIQWHLADAEQPAVRVDIASAGLERWLHSGWLAAGTIYARRSSGVLLFDPMASWEERNPSLDTGRQTGGGAEVSLRKLTGKLTGSASYSLAREWTGAFERSYLSTLDVTHVVDVTASWQLMRRIAVSGAYGLASGATQTPLIAYYVPDTSGQPTRSPWRYSHSAPAPINSARDGVRQTLDVMFDWGFSLGGAADGAAYLQFRDILPWGDLYKDGMRSACLPAGVGCPSSSSLNGSFRHRTKWFPNLGLRFRF